MEENSNLKIVQRLLELAKNQIGEYNLFPRPFKEEQIWLANILHDSLHKHEAEFKAKFQEIVGHYKASLKDKLGYGWFHSAEKLVWKQMQINQLMYAIYGDKFQNKDLVFNKKLGNDAYRDFICQIDRTALMTPKELEIHHKECNKIGKEIVAEILKKEKGDKKDWLKP